MTASLCEFCGGQIPTDAPGGFCPSCLLKEGLDEPEHLTLDHSTGASPAAYAPFTPPSVGELGPYFPQLNILELIGQGGMGAVYKVKQVKLDRVVALKIIHPDSAADPSFAERFSREARALARLNHPQIVGVHDFGEFPFGYFIVMEYVGGANLRQLLENGSVTVEQAISVMAQICDALQYAHDEGVVHRDIKPENILVDSQGRVKIADFGLARLAAGQDPDKARDYFTLTGTRQILGTPRYMAPEQLEAAKSVDHRADIYALGVLFYEMLTGEVPMGSFDPPSRKSSIDSRLDDVVLRALAREPERRYQRVNELADAIAAFSGRPADVSPPPFVSVSQTRGGRKSGLNTIIDREAAAVVPWITSAFEGNPTPHREPTLLMLATCVIGAITIIFPWLEVTSFTPVVHGIAEDLTEPNGPITITLKGMDQWCGIVSASVFGLLAVMVTAIPMKRGPIGLLAVMMLISTIPLVATIGYRYQALRGSSLTSVSVQWDDTSWQQTAPDVSDTSQPDVEPEGDSESASPETQQSDSLESEEDVSHEAGSDSQEASPKTADSTDESPMRLALTTDQYEWKGAFYWSLGTSIAMLLFSTVSVRHASLQAATARTRKPVKLPVGRDWVTLTKNQVERDDLPKYCMVCGDTSTGRVNRTFQWAPDWAGLLTIAGVVPGIIALATTSREFRVSCPVCTRHVGHWARFAWVCSTGWLVVILMGVLGGATGWALNPENQAWGIAGLIFCAVTSLAIWIITMVRMGLAQVRVTRITSDAITFDRVSAEFAEAVNRGQPQDAEKSANFDG